jgi:pilin isopeptide linkage protein
VRFVLAGLEDGDYYYRITENPGNTAGWSYSSISYAVQVAVTDGEAEVIYPGGYSADLPPLFTNSYYSGGGGESGTTEPPASTPAEPPATTAPETPDVRTPDANTPATPPAPGGNDPQVPPVPTVSGSSLVPGDNGTFIEIGEDGVPLGAWHWDDPLQEWVFEEYQPPLANLPQTGAMAGASGTFLLLALLLLAAGCSLMAVRLRRQGRHYNA